MASAIVFDAVSKRFGNHVALADLSLQLTQGAITAVVGESGSGKSTLLEHINGLLTPDTGTVAVLGELVDYTALLGLRRRIGYAVQGTGLFPHLCVGDNIALLAQLERWSAPRIEARRALLLEFMDLEQSMLSRYPHQLSGGQQQRVGICRAMMLEPPLLLLDEAFSGVDPMTRRSIHNKLRVMQRDEDTTVVLVTHDLREARDLADDIVILRDGRMLQHASVRSIMDSPADEYIERLFREYL